MRRDRHGCAHCARCGRDGSIATHSRNVTGSRAKIVFTKQRTYERSPKQRTIVGAHESK